MEITRVMFIDGQTWIEAKKDIEPHWTAQDYLDYTNNEKEVY